MHGLDRLVVQFLFFLKKAKVSAFLSGPVSSGRVPTWFSGIGNSGCRPAARHLVSFAISQIRSCLIWYSGV